MNKIVGKLISFKMNTSKIFMLLELNGQTYQKNYKRCMVASAMSTGFKIITLLLPFEKQAIGFKVN